MVMERLDESVYLIGLTTLGSQAVFLDPDRANALLKCLKELRENREFSQHAYVVMPDAFFGIVTPRQTLTKAVSLIKRCTTEALEARRLWSPGFLREPIEDVETLLRWAGSIHRLPMEQGLVDDPENYPFSSLASLDADPVN